MSDRKNTPIIRLSGPSDGPAWSDPGYESDEVGSGVLRPTCEEFLSLISQMEQQNEKARRDEFLRRNSALMAENSGKRANDLNGVSFGELIRQLGAEVS